MGLAHPTCSCGRRLLQILLPKNFAWHSSGEEPFLLWPFPVEYSTTKYKVGLHSPALQEEP